MAHFGVSAAVTDHLNRFTVLGQSDSEGAEAAASILEVNLSVELFTGVDLKVVSGTVVTVG